MQIPQIVSQATPINLYTSVAGNTDYRYGLDFSLVTCDQPVTVLADTNGPTFPLPLMFPPNSSPQSN